MDSSKKKLSKEYREYILKYFPPAVRGDIVSELGNRILQNHDHNRKNTLFGTSFCPDEINEFVTNFQKTWESRFTLGGLGGVPFAGTTGFNAFSQHRPDNGNLFILFASHIGIDEQGTLGTILRNGMTENTVTCGSAITAYELVNDELKKEMGKEEWDLQQKYMEGIVKERLKTINSSSIPLLGLTEVVYHEIYDRIMNIISDDYEGNIALFGGIQINTSLDYHDYFLIKEFKIINPKNKSQINLIDDLKESILNHR